MQIVHLRAGGCSLVLDVGGGRLPTVLHWGADLGDVATGSWAGVAEASAPAVAAATLDQPVPRSLVREHAAGHPGRPTLSGHRAGSDWSTSFALAGLEQPAEHRLTVRAADTAAGLGLRSEIELSPSGLLRLRHTLRNEGDSPYVVNELLCALPLPGQATELLDLSGRWCRERHPQRHPLELGSWVRENRRGRTGHDATIGLVAGTPGFGFRHGEVWAVHVGWSGNHVSYAGRWPSGDAVLGGGELLLPGEVSLAPAEEYATPWLYAAYSPHGLDGIAAAFHGYLRRRSHHPGPNRPRPVVLNTWEAVYFDHDFDRLRGLAGAAAEIGVERFVLDDGWFRSRRDDTAGLGDWYVDETVWPHGLEPLISHVRSLGMQFGLWVEPEMISPDSDLYRAHPDWILATGEGCRGPTVTNRVSTLPTRTPTTTSARGSTRCCPRTISATLSGTTTATSSTPATRHARVSMPRPWPPIGCSTSCAPHIPASRSEERRVGKSVDLGGRRIIKKKKKKQ